MTFDPHLLTTTDTTALEGIYDPQICAVFWNRSQPSGIAKFLQWVSDTNQALPFFASLKCTTDSLRDEVVSRLRARYYEKDRPIWNALVDDICMIADIYQNLTGLSDLQLRLDHKTHRRKFDPGTNHFHRDGRITSLRFVTSYQGPGTEYLSPCTHYPATLPGRLADPSLYHSQDIRRMNTSDILLFKGSGYRVDDDISHLLYHRAPAIQQDQPDRLVLVLEAQLENAAAGRGAQARQPVRHKVMYPKVKPS